MEDEIEPHQFLLAALMISVTPVHAAPKAASQFQHRSRWNELTWFGDSLPKGTQTFHRGNYTIPESQAS